MGMKGNTGRRWGPRRDGEDHREMVGTTGEMVGTTGRWWGPSVGMVGTTGEMVGTTVEMVGTTGEMLRTTWEPAEPAAGGACRNPEDTVL